ncbi:uncharacterized protein L3040_000435 [Drepanopeziza brunnea f. sp. 'multigermtubi']|nr:hypothetical protein L3040_000435 [Drepanopeziza brunnea f. sp. 'multigermtubi']
MNSSTLREKDPGWAEEVAARDGNTRMGNGPWLQKRRPEAPHELRKKSATSISSASPRRDSGPRRDDVLHPAPEESLTTHTMMNGIHHLRSGTGQGRRGRVSAAATIPGVLLRQSYGVSVLGLVVISTIWNYWNVHDDDASSCVTGHLPPLDQGFFPVSMLASSSMHSINQARTEPLS